MNTLDLENELRKNQLPNYSNLALSVGDTIQSFMGGELALPPFQRVYVWDLFRASKLIESILLGIPVPAMYLYKNTTEDNRLIIDGQQRILTLVQFRMGKWLNEKGLTELSKVTRSTLCEGTLRSILISKVFNNPENYTDFKLQNCKNEFLNGVSFIDLPPNFKRQFRFAGIPVNLFTSSPKEASALIHDVFRLINEGGVPITKSELEVLLNQA